MVAVMNMEHQFLELPGLLVWTQPIMNWDCIKVLGLVLHAW